MKDTVHVMRKIGRFLERSKFTYKEAALGCLFTVSRLMDANKSQDLATYKEYYDLLHGLQVSTALKMPFVSSSFIKALCDIAIETINTEMS